MAEVGIQSSWSLRDFRDAFGKMKLTGTLTNSKTGETFQSCAFVDSAGATTLVGFSSNLGVLTASEIKSQVDDLQVVKLESGNYKLCKKGSSSWEDVDF